MRVDVTIDRLSLAGVRLSRAERRLLVTTVQRELGQRVQGPAPDARVESLGRDIGTAVRAAMSRSVPR
jgi:hypothetical protein